MNVRQDHAGTSSDRLWLRGYRAKSTPQAYQLTPRQVDEEDGSLENLASCWRLEEPELGVCWRRVWQRLHVQDLPPLPPPKKCDMLLRPGVQIRVQFGWPWPRLAFSRKHPVAASLSPLSPEAVDRWHLLRELPDLLPRRPGLLPCV